VAANTLIGLQKNDATLFDTVAIKAKEEELKDAKHKIFSAKTVRTKRKYRKMVNDLRQEIADMLLKGGVIGNDEARQLASWDMFDQNASSPFFDPEWMFGVKDGFDIVIGNPPYGAKLTNEEKSLYGTTYRNKTSETAILFIEKAINLIGYDGVQLYIIPKAFTYSSNYESIREYVRKNLAQIVDCGKAFENVKLEACIEIVNKKNISDNYKNVLYVNKSFISLGLIDKSTKDIFGFYLNGVSPSSIAVAMKMRINSTLLGKISTNVRGDALQQSLNFEIGKPVVGGINIDRYGIKDFKGYITKGVTYNNKAVIKDNSLLFQNIIAHIANPYPHIKLIGCVPSNLDYLIIEIK
jgi:16S rRNA G966 N2-methylase RsmD